MRNTLAVERLLDAAAEYAEQRDILRDARSEYGGHSFDYVYRHQIGAMQRSAELFGNLLDAYIDKRIAARLTAPATPETGETM